MGAQEANFYNKRTTRTTPEKPYRPNSVIPDAGKYQDQQIALEKGMIATLAAGRLMQRNVQTGELEIADRYWFDHRAHVETKKAESGPDTYEIVGGWVTRDQAILELAEANEPEPETAIRLETRQAA